jgi:hypothetical protein
MKKLAFAALVVTAIIGATTAGTLRQSPQEPLPAEETGWSITPAHARMW